MILHQFSLEHKELKPTDFNDLQQIDGGMKMSLFILIIKIINIMFITSVII
jgi:hypothetical protein